MPVRKLITVVPMLAILCASWIATAVEYTTLPYDASQKFALQVRMEKLQQLLDQADDYQRYVLLDTAARTAMELKLFNKADIYANELIGLATKYPEDWNYSSALHQSRIILGKIALRNDDMATAKRYLLAAGKVPASDLLNQRRPDFALAQTLLDTDEKTTVKQYLDLCKNLWPDGLSLLDHWQQQLASGKTPRLVADPTDD